MVVRMMNIAGVEAASRPSGGRVCVCTHHQSFVPQVTVVRNLEAYGLDPCTVAAILQQRCQASTTVTPVPGAKDSLQVQIQGNQVHHLGRLLLGEYPF